MTELSPAAQKVLTAFNDRHELCGPFEDDWVEQCLAAAIEALADQNRDQILTIAAELRGDTTTPTETP